MTIEQIKFLCQLLQYDEINRIDSDELLKHPYIRCNLEQQREVNSPGIDMKEKLKVFNTKDPFLSEQIDDAYEEQMNRIIGEE